MIKENPRDWPDISIDLETTGVDGSNNAIIQIAACRFDLLLGQVNTEEKFEVCLDIPYGRYWDEDTRKWWCNSAEKRAIYEDITARAIPAAEAMKQFMDWLGGATHLKVWAKPSHFEFPFLASYFKQFGYDNPFHYRKVENQHSWIRARYWPHEPAITDYTIPMEGEAHNAMNDVMHQITTLMAVANHTRGLTLP